MELEHPDRASQGAYSTAAMRVFYVDDSGNDDMTVIAAVTFVLERLPEVLKQWLGWRKWLMRTHRLPVDYELYAQEFISGHGRVPPLEAPPDIDHVTGLRIQAYRRSLEQLDRQQGVHVTAIAREGLNVTAVYAEFVESIDAWLGGRGELGLCIVDGGDASSYRPVHAEQAAGRPVFDDLGALFWRLPDEQPTVAAAYSARYPIVIADEHQDASALQDAIVRRLGIRRLVVFADHLQLIHGYRGADLERMRAHWRDSGAQHQLGTPHRWHGRGTEGGWLLGLRDALQGRTTTAPRPAGVRYGTYPAERGINGALPQLKCTVPEIMRGPTTTSLAILVSENADLARVRKYLSSNGLYPRQLGGTPDFDEARQDIEQLPLLADAQSVALHTRERLVALVPTIPATVVLAGPRGSVRPL
jgi:UvrD-like helicase family protein